MSVATACPCCQAWEESRSGRYAAGCEQCTARQLAGSYEAWQMTHHGKAAGLRSATTRAFGPERYAEGRAMVLRWIDRIKAKAAQAAQEGKATW